MNDQLNNQKTQEFPEVAATEILAEISDIVVQSALGRLLLTLSEQEVAKLELYLDTHSGGGEVLEYLLQEYPTFHDLIEEEAQALADEAAELAS